MEVIHTSIFETTQGSVTIERTVHNITIITATTLTGTVSFRFTYLDVHQFPRMVGEDYDAHMKRYILHRLAEAQDAALLPTPAPNPEGGTR